MAKISKKIVRQINLTSVFEKTLRERFESTLIGFFLDSPPEMWNDEQRQAFDMVTQVEDELKAAILEVLGVNAPTAEGAQPSPNG